MIEAAPYAELPEFIPPELATLVNRPPQGDQWLHEIKFDGYRTAARLAGGSVSMLTRRGLDWTAKFAPIARDLTSLNARAAYIDGEVVVLDQAGVSSFAGLQEALLEGRADRMLYFAFDLLHLDGRDLRGLPLLQRKEALKALLAGTDADARVRYSEHRAGSRVVPPCLPAASRRDRLKAARCTIQIRPRRRLAQNQVHETAGVGRRRLASVDTTRP